MESFRFLQASDFHLDQTPGGITELQDGLIDHLIEATYKSVDSVFDTAIRERVDFVLLSGNILPFTAPSPRAIDFLSTQFERLHEKKIPTYWLGGPIEAGSPMPPELRLPKSVHRLSTSRVQTLEMKRNRKTIAYIVGQSAGGHSYPNLEEMRVPRDGRFFVGMRHVDAQQQLDADLLDDLGIDYWALGGRHAHETLKTIIPAHFCGSPQARAPLETGQHGCLVVSVTGDQIDDAEFVATDFLRYRTERIEVRPNDDRQQLVDKVKSRLQSIQNDIQPGKPLLVTWEIVDDGQLGRQLRDPAEFEPFLEQLRVETRIAGSASGSQLAFTIGLRSFRSSIPGQSYEEDSMLGDFLRVARELEKSTSAIDLDSYLPKTQTARKMMELQPDESQESRQQLLREVTTMGIDMLGGNAANGEAA